MSGSEILDRKPPFDLDAETAVIGSIMLNPDVGDDVELILTSDDFYDDANRRLFAMLSLMRSETTAIDITLVVERLRNSGEFEAIGGTAYLFHVAQSVPNAAHARYYAKIVRQKSILRRIINVAVQMLSDGYEECDPDELLAKSEAAVMDIRDSRRDSSIKHIKEHVHVALDRLERMTSGDDASVVDTGFDSLNALCSGGMRNGNFIVLAARPSMGKTALATNIASYVASHAGAPVLFVSIEMTADELTDRILSSTSKVHLSRILKGTTSNTDRNRIVEKAASVASGLLYIEDSGNVRVSDIAAHARRVKRQHDGLGLLVIDYLQLIEPDTQRDNRQEQVAKISRRLKRLSKEIGCPVLCLAQLNRQVEDSKDHRPKLSSLRESGAIEQDADAVWFVHREEYYLRGEAANEVQGLAEIIVAKQRNGMTGDVQLRWDRDHVEFTELAPERLQEFDDYNERASEFKF